MHTRQRLGRIMAQQAVMGSENLGFAHDTENSGYNRRRVFAFRRKRHIRIVVRSCLSGGINITILWVNNPRKRKSGSMVYLEESQQSSVIKRIHIENDAESGQIKVSTKSTRKHAMVIRAKRR